jgi:tetratricopeptide (TPR) repeat protein
MELLQSVRSTLVVETERMGGHLREEPKKGLFIILAILLAAALIPFFFLVKGIYSATLGRKLKTTLREDYLLEAERYVKKGRFVSAANIYDTKLKDYEKAAELYERGGEFERAAVLYDLRGMFDKARKMYMKKGDLDSAAEISFRLGEYEETSRLYYEAGKKADSALIFERAGRRLAAVRIYREMGKYRRAAELLAEEGMPEEAAEMFSLSLGEKELNESNVGEYYAYALMLEKAGEREKTVAVLEGIYRLNPDYCDVYSWLQSLTPEVEEDSDTKGKTSLRGFIRAGKIEPRLGLKLWVHILKRLPEAYEQGHPYGFLSPDNIFIDADNNISFMKNRLSPYYIPPETSKGLDLDIRSDIYSMGVILYEMLSGNLDGLGSMRVVDMVSDVPDWLDEIVITCIKKVRDDRYGSVDEILAHLKALSGENSVDGR